MAQEEGMTTLPESFVNDGLKLANEATIMGKKFSDMTRDELVAVAVHGWIAEAKAREEGARSVRVMANLQRIIR